MSDAALAARTLLARSTYGVLATHSVAQPGYPLGSVTPFVLDANGCPLILISSIAQHTRNVQADVRCSLTVTEPASDDVQAAGRLCLLADAEPLPAEDAAIGERYFAFFPEARSYHKAHDFAFWRLRPVRLRYIGGFGKIHWFDPATVIRPNPLSWADESRAVQHMNADHQAALRSYCRHAGLPESDADPVMAGADGEALYLRLGRRIHRLPFNTPVTNLDELRQATIAMCQATYWSPPAEACA